MVDDKLHEAALNSEFKVVWEILNALMEQDSDLADAVKHIGRSGDNTGNTSEPYDKFFKFMNHNPVGNLNELIKVKVLNRFISPWDTMFARLLEYQEQYGTLIPDKNVDPELYHWVIQQRGGRSKLPPHRIVQLNSINFEWPPDPEDIWNEKYEELKAFREEFGDAIVPTRDPKYKSLSSFVEHSRQKIKNKLLDEDKAAKLNALGVGVISGEDLKEKKWMRKYKLMIQYNKKHGTTIIPQRVKEDGLGKWCNRQRLLQKNNKLPLHRYKLLKMVNFVFHPEVEVWETRVQQNIEWLKTKGRISEELRNWRSSIRKSYKKGSLSSKKVQQIKKIDPDLLDVQVLTTHFLRKTQNESYA